ncbi:MAG: homocysteine S-methyltransferase family protein [Bacteroidia bacterium]
MNKPDIRELLSKRILILDGAMGTMIQKYKLEEKDFRNEALAHHPKPLKGNNDLLSITRPDIIKAIHLEYLEAGADILETNTFSGTTIAQEDYGCQHLVHDINYLSAKIACEAADEMTAKDPSKPRYVAGSMGPTNKTASISPDINDPGKRTTSFNELRIAFKDQAKSLIEGGVDILLLETIIDTLNAKAALFGIQELFDEGVREVPIMVSGTITDASGRTLSGQTTEAFLISVQHIPLLSIGLNCALGAAAMRPYLQVLDQKAPFFVHVYPNAGLPNEFGQYDESPEFMGKQVEEFLKEGLVNILGGCCGTTPAHIRVMAEIAEKYGPRVMVNGQQSTVNG